MKTKTTKIIKTTGNKTTSIDDAVAIEKPLEIRLGHNKQSFQTLSITLCTPTDINDLIIGNLFTENIITKRSDINGIKLYDNELGVIAEVILIQTIDYKKHLNKRHGMIHASCGICGKTSIDDLITFNYPTQKNASDKIEAEIIYSLPEKLKQKQQGFTQTGGLHASALFSHNGQLQIVREDIGRHNALDKLIGSALQNNLLPLENYIILLSGRISFELVHKSLLAGATTLCAIGAPSSLSIEIAKLNKLTLIGFIKENSYNAY